METKNTENGRREPTGLGKVYKKAFLHFSREGKLNFLPDSLYLRMAYRARVGRHLNLKNPRTYTEKLQWLKLHDRNPEYTRMVDKYLVKSWVEEKIGPQYVIPTLGVWDRFEDIDFDSLPSRFVLKCTHDSGGLVIVRDKDTMDREAAREKISQCLRNEFFYKGREWPYKDVKPRILAEAYMEDESGYELKDYKFFCFNGKARMMFIASDRYSADEAKADYYDMDFHRLPITCGHPASSVEWEKPATFQQMRDLAEKLSQGIPQVRVDFYDVNGQVYFGEMTFFHWDGMMPFQPESWDRTIGDWIELPRQ